MSCQKCDEMRRLAEEALREVEAMKADLAKMAKGLKRCKEKMNRHRWERGEERLKVGNVVEFLDEETGRWSPPMKIRKIIEGGEVRATELSSGVEVLVVEGRDAQWRRPGR